MNSCSSFRVGAPCRCEIPGGKTTFERSGFGCITEEPIDWLLERAEISRPLLARTGFSPFHNLSRRFHGRDGSELESYA